MERSERRARSRVSLRSTWGKACALRAVRLRRPALTHPTSRSANGIILGSRELPRAEKSQHRRGEIRSLRENLNSRPCDHAPGTRNDHTSSFSRRSSTAAQTAAEPNVVTPTQGPAGLANSDTEGYRCVFYCLAPGTIRTSLLSARCGRKASPFENWRCVSAARNPRSAARPCSSD